MSEVDQGRRDALVLRYVNAHGLFRSLGIKGLSMGGGTATSEARVREAHRNPDRSANGGLISALADQSCGLAVGSLLKGREYSVTVNLEVSFVAPARGTKLVAEAEVLRRGRTLATAQAKIADEAGVVAIATATYYITAWPDGAAPPKPAPPKPAPPKRPKARKKS